MQACECNQRNQLVWLVGITNEAGKCPRFHEGCDAQMCVMYNPTMREIYKSFPPTWPPLFKALFAANKALSMIAATVRTPPTMAQVLDGATVSNLIRW